MEFLLYLTPIGRDIYNLMSQKVKFVENPPICRQHNVYGWYDSKTDTMSICTDTIKKSPNPKHYVNETLFHEAVHAAQDCKAQGTGMWYVPFGISPKDMKLNETRKRDLEISVKLTSPSNRAIEREAFWMEDKPEKVKYVVKKYCL